MKALESGNNYSKNLARDIRNGEVQLTFKNLPKDIGGRYYSGQGEKRLYVASELVYKGEFNEAASSVVHESQHMLDDFAGKIGRFDDIADNKKRLSPRRIEFRAHARQFEFEWFIREGSLFNAYTQFKEGFTGVGRLIEFNYPWMKK